MAEMTRKQKLSALLIWLAQQPHGIVDADHPGLDRYSDDFEPTDTINAAFRDGLAVQTQWGKDAFSVELTEAGRRALDGGASG